MGTKKGKKPIIEATRRSGLAGWTAKVKVFANGKATIQANRRRPVEKKLLKKEVDSLIGLFETKFIGLGSIYNHQPSIGTYRYTITYMRPDGTSKKVIANQFGYGSNLPQSLNDIISAINELISNLAFLKTKGAA